MPTSFLKENDCVLLFGAAKYHISESVTNRTRASQKKNFIRGHSEVCMKQGHFSLILPVRNNMTQKNNAGSKKEKRHEVTN